jgi:hypothetical protein
MVIQLFNFSVNPDAILLLIKVMRNCHRWYTDPPWLHFEPPCLHSESLELLNFNFNAIRIQIELFTLMRLLNQLSKKKFFFFHNEKL